MLFSKQVAEKGQDDIDQPSLIVYKTGGNEVEDKHFSSLLYQNLNVSKCSARNINEIMSEKRPDALVCIAGALGVINTFNSFREQFRDRLIFLLPATGGAAEMLSREFGNGQYVRVMDEKETLPEVYYDDKSYQERIPEEFRPFLYPFALLASDITEELENYLNQFRG